MKRFDSAKWITENKHGKLSEMKYAKPFDQEEEDPKNPMGLPEVEKDSKAVDVTSYDDDPDSDLAYAQRHGMANTMEVEKDPDAQAAAPKAAPKKPSGEKKDYTSTEDFGTLFPDAMKGGLGKARANMPQVPADDFETDLESPAGDGLETNEPEKIPNLGKATTAYLNSSDDTGPWPKGDQVNVSVEKGIDPMDLKPTQADIYMSNALKKVKSAEEGTWKPWASSVLASNDGHILDGHHRWAATIVYNDKNGTNEKMSINKVDMPIKDLLKVANAYTDAHPDGVRQGGAGTATENQDPRASLYEQLENHINKNLNEMDNYNVDYYVVYDKKTGKEMERFQKPPNNRGLRDAERYIRRMEMEWDDVEVGQYGIRLDTETHSMEE